MSLGEDRYDNLTPPSYRDDEKLSSIVYDLAKRVRALENEIDLIKLKEDI